MRLRDPNDVGRAVQTDPTLSRYASAITEQMKCWELNAQKSDRYQTLRNNIQQGVQTDARMLEVVGQQYCVRLRGLYKPIFRSGHLKCIVLNLVKRDIQRKKQVASLT